MQSDVRTVLFTELCDTASFRLDDVEGHKLAARSLKLVADVARRDGGKVVKTVGNSLMVTFMTVESAYRAAKIMQLALRSSPVSMKSAMHVGDVITTNDDIFGDTINVAAHLLTQATAGDIMMTGNCVYALPIAERQSVLLIETTTIPGRPEWIQIHRALRDGETPPPAQPAMSRPVALVVTYKGSSIRIAAGDEPFAMGREASCSLRLASAVASRNHATISWRDEGFVLTDSSGHGTFIIDVNGNEVHLTRADYVIDGDGVMSLGVPCDGNERDIIHFECEWVRASAASQRAETPAVDAASRIAA
jgi:class 3 adenylate cyclase